MKHFTDAEKQKAIDLYFGEKLTTQGVVDRLGYPTRQNLERWLRKDPRYGENMRHGFYPIELKTKAVEMCQTGGYTVEQIAEHLNLPSPGSIYYWVYKARDYGYEALMPQVKRANMPKRKTFPPPDDPVSLMRRCEELELDNAILQETIEILKKDPGADSRALNRREKSQVIGALQMRAHYPMQDLLRRMNLSPSSYYY